MSGQPDKPLWRKTFDKAERAVGGRLEEMIDTREFADAMSTTARVQKAVANQVYGTIHKTLHLFGLTSLKDTRAITRQLNRVEAQLREVSAQLEALEEKQTDPEPAPPRTRKSTGARRPPTAKTVKPVKAVKAVKPVKNAPQSEGQEG